MKRQRGRGRKPGGGGGGGNNNHNHGNRSLESSGPEVKIRGTAAKIYEKYAQYARDAQSGGDRVKYEALLQHAEHYYRVMAASMPRDRLLAQQNGEGGMQQGQQPGDSVSVQHADIGMQQAGMASTTAMGSGAMGSGTMSGGMTGFDDYDNDYRSHYQTAYGSAGYTYDDYAPVYRYGHSLAIDSRYSGREWSDIETDARHRWEERNPGTWEQFKETVRFAWDKARGKR